MNRVYGNYTLTITVVNSGDTYNYYNIRID